MKLKDKSQPKTLQPWQAYHALTYESHWKPHVDTAWTEYQKAWKSEHLNVKPEKSRFQIMVEFMKAKFQEEDDKMKDLCEKYRKPETREEVSPAPVKSVSAINGSW